MCHEDTRASQRGSLFFSCPTRTVAAGTAVPARGTPAPQNRRSAFFFVPREHARLPEESAFISCPTRTVAVATAVPARGTPAPSRRRSAFFFVPRGHARLPEEERILFVSHTHGSCCHSSPGARNTSTSKQEEHVIFSCPEDTRASQRGSVIFSCPTRTVAAATAVPARGTPAPQNRRSAFFFVPRGHARLPEEERNLFLSHTHGSC